MQLLTDNLRVKAVLAEIGAALTRLADTGETWTIFSDKMALSSEERQLLRDCLGIGEVKITMSGGAEPAEWQESGTSGVWYGVFYGLSREPVAETIEIAFFPQVAAVQQEDLQQAIATFTLSGEQ